MTIETHVLFRFLMFLIPLALIAILAFKGKKKHEEAISENPDAKLMDTARKEILLSCVFAIVAIFLLMGGVRQAPTIEKTEETRVKFSTPEPDQIPEIERIEQNKYNSSQSREDMLEKHAEKINKIEEEAENNE